MSGPQPFDARNRVSEKPSLAGEAVRNTWNMVWPCMTPEQAAEQAATLAEFFADEVMVMEAKA